MALPPLSPRSWEASQICTIVSSRTQVDVGIAGEGFCGGVYAGEQEPHAAGYEPGNQTRLIMYYCIFASNAKDCAKLIKNAVGSDLCTTLIVLLVVFDFLRARRNG